MRSSLVILTALLLIGLLPAALLNSDESSTATTQVFIGACGDGIVHPGQECDRGEYNMDEYSLTIEGRNCGTDCRWYAYCGDGIVQPEYGEECDDGTNEDDGFCSADCRLLDEEEEEENGEGEEEDEEDEGDEEGEDPDEEPGAPPSPGGPGGGGGGHDPGDDDGIGPTVVSAEGLAYPNSEVVILKDGDRIGSVTAESNGFFTFTTDEVTSGATTFGFRATDERGVESMNYTTTFEVSEGATTQVADVYIPPTITIEERELDPGDVLQLSGQTVPGAELEIRIHSETYQREETVADDDGFWELEVDTSSLSRGQHSVKARFQVEVDEREKSSSFSDAHTFALGEEVRDDLTADLNGDGRVHLADFSILLFHWGTDSTVADINNDGQVGLADFSIMMHQWTG